MESPLEKYGMWGGELATDFGSGLSGLAEFHPFDLK
jgi:hypothetical protein